MMRISTALLVAGIMAVSGCSRWSEKSPQMFGPGGVPAENYRVGGGFQIRYTAPEPGVVYLVEQRTGTLLGTESLLRGQMFEFFPTSEVVEGFNRVGIELSKGEFVIYFVPASHLYHR